MAQSMSDFDRLQAGVIARALGQPLEDDDTSVKEDVVVKEDPKPDAETDTKPWHERYSEEDIKELERKAKLTVTEDAKADVSTGAEDEVKDDGQLTILDMIIKAADAELSKDAKPAKNEQDKKNENNPVQKTDENEYIGLVVERGKEIVNISRNGGYDPKKILSTIDSFTPQELVGIAAFKLKYEEELLKQKAPVKPADSNQQLPAAEIRKADITQRRVEERPAKKQSVFYK